MLDLILSSYLHGAVSCQESTSTSVPGLGEAEDRKRRNHTASPDRSEILSSGLESRQQRVRHVHPHCWPQALGIGHRSGIETGSMDKG